MLKKAKITDPTAAGQGGESRPAKKKGIKRRSKVPGVMITQYIQELPEGKTTPDFTRKPIPLTIQEGKLAIFKAVVIGDPEPVVTWSRANGDINDPVKYQMKFDPTSREHTLEMPRVSADEADTYKCYACNEFGKAVCTVVLNIIEVAFKRKKAMEEAQAAPTKDPTEFRKMLRKCTVGEKDDKKYGEIDEKVWEILLSADKKDYERICLEYGITDFRGMLKKLNDLKKEREEEQAKFLEHLSSLRHIEVRSEDTASFELEMVLKDPNSRIFLYKDGVMIPYSKDEEMEMKHQLKQVGKKYVFTIKNLKSDDAGLYQVDVEGANVFSTDFKIPPVDFIVKIQEVNAEEREDAVFQCVLSQPMANILWMGKNNPLTAGEKYDIIVSEDKLIHKLVIKDCLPLDQGIYAAVAGIKSCNAWLIVEQPGVHFTSGLEDVSAILGESAELVCKLSSAASKGLWSKDGKELSSSAGITISKDGLCHKLKIHKVSEEHSGKYRFEAEGRKTEAVIVVEDPPRFDKADLATFSEPVTVKNGQSATFKLPFVGREPMKVQWYREGEELTEDANIKVERAPGHSRLLIRKLHRKDSGEIKVKVKNEFGTIEAVSQLNVLDKPTPPQGPLEVIEGSASCIEIKWRPPKDDGGSQILHYNLERQQVGRNTWKKIGDIPGKSPTYRDTDVDHGKRYCYRIKAITAEGVSEVMETEDVQAGTKAYPGSPAAPKVVSAFKNCITLSWVAPTNTGGTSIVGYNLEKRKKGSNLWSPVNPLDEPIKEKTFAVKDIIEGLEYEFRVSAINFSGAGEPSVPSEFVFARDPKKPPGKVVDLKVTDSSYTTLSLSWSKPHEEAGAQDEAKGFFVEIRPADSPEWHRCNTNAISMTSYTIKGLKSMAMYWVRVIGANDGGEGGPQELNNYILAMPPPVRPRFTDAKMNSFMVVRAGNSARVNINFEASPVPEIIWLKDGTPVSKRITISNAEGTSQLLIASSERSDTGVYTIIIKNLVGQETFSVEIRVTDEPKPPGPVELDENVPGTVTVSWTPSPDEKRDDRLHYMVSKRDSVKRTWHTVADHLFNNRFTVCNIMPGREYYFRVYAKNDMGLSDPSESPVWSVTRKKEKFHVNVPESKPCNLERPPKFLIPLKMHTAPQGYECYMSCAVRGDPAPHVTWYRNNISLNTNTNYYISNTCGVCSMLILRVGPKDTGEYKVIAENPLGRAECSTNLIVRE
ncbi:immunoglobulin-like and fibronectin type III domain-containing protein 1 [Megalops cyprinoides]|uniref:immunoglobulin-like and fibronectin type III domain-containing protein 1 n=1 Tax=Megalops cyprinoides TaxID=118141 RepID=UPI0018650CF8|nr:immunoglobulin-like and fibronectin type III domain-containing protein 1 [Megalops cyprinoides]